MTNDLSASMPAAVAAPKTAEDHIAGLSALNEALSAARAEGRRLEAAAEAALQSAVADAERFGLRVERSAEAGVGRIFALAADLRKPG